MFYLNKQIKYLLIFILYALLKRSMDKSLIDCLQGLLLCDNFILL